MKYKDMKDTSVDYLFTQLWETPKDKFAWYNILLKAKEMHQQEIEEAFITGEYQQGFELEAKQYYQETYEKYDTTNRRK